MLTWMARGGLGFLQYWHDRQLVLDDGEILSWCVIERPGGAPWIAYYRTDRRGGIHETIGHRLLVEHGHPDAALGMRGDHVGTGRFH